MKFYQCQHTMERHILDLASITKCYITTEYPFIVKSNVKVKILFIVVVI